MAEGKEGKGEADLPKDGKFGDLRPLLKEEKIRLAIHSYLETTQLCVNCRIANWWKKYLSGPDQDPAIWLSANLARSAAHSVTDGALTAFFKAHPSIENLNLRFCSKITDATLIAAATFLPNLKIVALEGCGRAIGNKGVQALARCPKLSELDLNGCLKVTAEALQLVASSCPELTALSISGIPVVDDANLQAILRARDKRKKLSRLCLNSCSKLSDVGLRAICILGESLLELEVAYCPALSDDGVIELIRACPNIVSLNLYGCFKITDKTLAAIGALNSLKDLNLSMCRGITDVGITQLLEGKGVCNVIESLNLYDCTRITDASLRALTRCPKLRFLGAFGLDELTYDALVAFLGSAKALERIDIGGCQKVRDRLAELSKKYTRVSF